MVSILINVKQKERYFFLFWHMFLLSACSSQSHATSCMSHMSHHRVNNKCNRVKRTTLKMANLPLCDDFQKQPPLFLKVSKIPQENTCGEVSFFS